MVNLSRFALFAALGDSDLEKRYSTANQLLDAGADVQVTTTEGQNVFHVLFSQTKHDLPQLVALTGRLIELGADINTADDRRITPTHELVNLKFTDDDLAELSILWFSQPGLDLSVQNVAGLTALELARKLPYRADMVGRMERGPDSQLLGQV